MSMVREGRYFQEINIAPEDTEREIEKVFYFGVRIGTISERSSTKHIIRI